MNGEHRPLRERIRLGAQEQATHHLQATGFVQHIEGCSITQCRNRFPEPMVKPGSCVKTGRFARLTDHALDQHGENVMSSSKAMAESAVRAGDQFLGSECTESQESPNQQRLGSDVLAHCLIHPPKDHCQHPKGQRQVRIFWRHHAHREVTSNRRTCSKPSGVLATSSGIRPPSA